MVCKEDLCTWFRNLSPHKRIDYMCGILHLCIPIELRFLGSYVEFLAKKDFHRLRNVEGKANNKQELSNIDDIDKMIRTQMAFYLALLHSSNRTCAHQLFLMLKRYMQTAVTVMDRMDTQSVHNILLVLSMAMNHPAFSFVQKTEMFHFYTLAEQEAAKAKEKSATDRLYLSEPFGLYDLDLGTPMMFTPDVMHVHTINCQPVVPAQTMYSSVPPVVNIPVETEKVHVKHLEVKDSRPSKTDVNTIEYCIQVTWSNGEKRDVYKTLKEIMDFLKRMSKQFPDGLHSLKMQQLTGNTNHRKEMTSSLNKYVQKLLDLQANIKDAITFRKFFGAVVLTADASTSPTLQSVSHDNNPVAKNVPNSGNKDSVIEANTDNQNLSPLSNCLDGSHIGNICSMTNFCPSPQDLTLSAHSHAFSTKTASPMLGSPCRSTSSEPAINNCFGFPLADRLHCNRLASFLKCHDLAAYQNVLANYTFEQLSLMKVEEMESMGLPKEVAITMKSLLDTEKIKDFSPRFSNGVVDRKLPQYANHAAYSPPTVFPPQAYNTVPPAFLYGCPPFQNTAPQPFIIRDPSPTNSDSSSLSPRSCIQASPSMTIQSNVQSQSDSSSEEDKFARQPNSNEKSKAHSPFIPYQSYQSDQMVNNDNKYEPISSSETPPLALDLSEVTSLGNSDYRSDPTFDTSPVHFLRSPDTAKPAHTQNINPQYLFTMQGNSVPHQHNATMATASDGLGYSMVQYGDNRHRCYVNNSNMIGRTFGPFTGPRAYYGTGQINSNPVLNQQQQNVVNSVGKLPVYQGAQGAMLHNITGAVTGNNVMLNGSDNSQKIQCASAADASVSRMPVAINSATPGCATLTSTSNTGSISHPRCTSCGCSGHANSIPNPGIAVYHPFPYAWPPYNGYIPMPHSLYLPHQPPYANGLNQEVFANHAPSFAVPNLGAQGVTGSQVMQNPSNLNNSNCPPGGYGKKKSGKINCSNCGSLKHLATECPDGSMEAMSGPTLYSYRPMNELD